MNLYFQLKYRTNWGEDVRLLGSITELGENNPDEAIVMKTADGENWYVEISAELPSETYLSYTYLIFRGGIPIRKEWDAFSRTIQLRSTPSHAYHSFDQWRELPSEAVFYTNAFTKNLIARKRGFPIQRTYPKALVFKAFYPRVPNGYCIGLLGDHPALGGWNPEKVLLLNDATFPEWRIELDASRLCYPIEYKFVLYDMRDRSLVAWEKGNNRKLREPQIGPNETALIADHFLTFPLPEWKGAGVAIPVFSLRSGNSFGIGDFSDLKLMIDWAVFTHLKVVQILPIYDTTITHTWADSYPYNSISIYALHPIYLSLEKMGKLNSVTENIRFKELKTKLNSLTEVDYESVEHSKWDYFQLLYLQDGESILKSESFGSFFQANKEWLIPYAAFSYLRDQYHTADFNEWPRFSVYVQAEIEKLANPSSKEYSKIAFYYFLQYHLHLQLSEVTQYAHSKGIVLKGDIPIGISRYSVEAWKEPHYFHIGRQAGAPPDDFSANGQNWGFPTYNWETMAHDNYRWWIQRFQKMAEYFDAYRIDHILGFFRIWEIPTHAVQGILGQFSPALPLSAEEIESYGLTFQLERFTKPTFQESFLEDFFGSEVKFVKRTFMQSSKEPGYYQMQVSFDTQRKIEAYFEEMNAKKVLLPKQVRMRDKLYHILCDVLFISDHKEPQLYHPRINGQKTAVYQSLSESERAAFDRIHEDFFYHRHNEFWYQQGMQKLPQLISSTHMLVCGEDLGMIPACVPRAMNELQILSLEIQRMPKGWTEFANPSEYPYHSVSTLSTHDMSTLREWWQENPSSTQRYFNLMLVHQGIAPSEASGELCEEIIRRQLTSQSILCILSFQDWTSIDATIRNPNIGKERINTPSNPKNYWRYRMHLTLEKLLKSDTLNYKIRGLIYHSERNPLF